MKRIALGDIGGGAMGLRVSKIGYDVLTEPFNSANIGFDSRLTDFGLVHQTGFWHWGDPIITFPALPFIPICTFKHINASNRIIDDEMYVQEPLGPSGIGHYGTPFVGIVTSSTLEIKQLTNDYYSYGADAAGQFMYQVFAIEA